jgi:peptidoglycan/LPS O-acetylase OafA/YrhL
VLVPAPNKAINAIRFLAALAVLLGHIRVTMFADYSEVEHDGVTALAYALTSLGPQAVLVFFALSGFWVGGAVIARTQRHDFTARDYAISRLSRLWLVLVPALLVTVVVDLVGSRVFATSAVYAAPSTYAGLEPQPSHSVGTLLGNLFFVQDIHTLTFGTNHPLWSLSAEFWYYALFPALLIATGRAASGRVRTAAIAVAAAACIVAGLDVLALFPAWLLGALAAWLSPAAHRFAGRRHAVVARVRLGAAGATLLAMMVARLAGPPLLVQALVIGVPTSVLLWTLTTDLHPTGWRLRGLRGLSRLAESSYSLYAIHMPLVVLLAAWLTPQRGDRWTLLGPAFGALLLVAAAFVALAAVFASFTEGRTDRVRRWARRVLPGGARATASARDEQLGARSTAEPLGVEWRPAGLDSVAGGDPGGAACPTIGTTR